MKNPLVEICRVASAFPTRPYRDIILSEVRILLYNSYNHPLGPNWCAIPQPDLSMSLALTSPHTSQARLINDSGMACDIAYQAEARVEVCVYQYDFWQLALGLAALGGPKSRWRRNSDTDWGIHHTSASINHWTEYSENGIPWMRLQSEAVRQSLKKTTAEGCVLKCPSTCSNNTFPQEGPRKYIMRSAFPSWQGSTQGKKYYCMCLHHSV